MRDEIIIVDAEDWPDSSLMVALAVMCFTMFFVGVVVGAMAAVGMVVWCAP